MSVAELRGFERSQVCVSSPTSKDCALQRSFRATKYLSRVPNREPTFTTYLTRRPLQLVSVGQTRARVKRGLKSHTQFRMIRLPSSCRSCFPSVKPRSSEQRCMVEEKEQTMPLPCGCPIDLRRSGRDGTNVLNWTGGVCAFNN